MIGNAFRFSNPSGIHWNIYRKAELCRASLLGKSLSEAPILAYIGDFSEDELTAMKRAYQEQGINGLRVTYRRRRVVA